MAPSSKKAAPPMDELSAAPRTVFRLTIEQRILYWGIGAAGGTLMVFLAATNSIAWLVGAVCAVFVALEGARTRVEVDRDCGQVISFRAMRRSVVRIEDVSAVRVPPWGPIALMLCDGAVKEGGGIWPNQLLTGLSTERRGGESSVAGQLAVAIGVPVISVHPGVRSDDE